MTERVLHALSSFAAALTRWTSRWVPSALSIALILTVFTFVLALAATDAGPLEVVKAWGSGFWEDRLLAFAMQMAVVMFTGYVVAVSPPVARALDALAARAHTPRGAVVLMAASSMLLAFLNWGLSIVGSAMLARFIARRAKGVDYRLLVASAYFGLGATWHAGFSASAPLIVATPGNFLEARLGGTIPIDRTLGSPFNLGLAVVAVVLLCAVAWALHPPPERIVLAYAWGDMATDLIQPFWALPLLAVARLEFKDILGFLLIAFLVYVPVVSVAFLVAF
jgi:short-chain fatty acids transporter